MAMWHVRAEIASAILLVVDFGGWYKLDSKSASSDSSHMIQHTQVSLLKDVIVPYTHMLPTLQLSENKDRPTLLYFKGAKHRHRIVHQMWERNDVKGVIAAMDKMSDHAVSADMASVLMEKSETITLDLCTSLLPVLTDLLESKTDRHLGVSLELLVKFVRTFGPVIHSTVSAGPSSVGVDLQAEQRRERCNLCFIELEKVKISFRFLQDRI